MVDMSSIMEKNDLRRILTGIILTLTVTCALFYLLNRTKKAPLPPGPKGRFPFLGMTFDMPKVKPWLMVADWGRKYGPLVHCRVGLQHHIFVGSGEIARELLDKRANIYSSRPPSEVGKIINENHRITLMPYNSQWRHTRRIFSSMLTPAKCDSYLSVLENEAICTLRNLKGSPSLFREEFCRYTLSVTRSVTFGKRICHNSDLFVREVKQLMDNFASAMTPGKYLFESIPLLRKLPRRFQPWMDELEGTRDFENSFSLRNYHDALTDSPKYPQRPCVARDVEREMEATGEVDRLHAATCCMSILGAGLETTATSFLFLIQALATHPEVVKKAHEELDRVIGRSRFPTWDDEPNLPYIRAIIKEQQRWRNVAPMSFTHWASEEDTYGGFRIPKGSIVRVNTWGLHADPDRYPEPEKFRPELSELWGCKSCRIIKVGSKTK